MQIASFCVVNAEENHTGLEWHEGEQTMTELSFLGELLL